MGSIPAETRPAEASSSIVLDQDVERIYEQTRGSLLRFVRSLGLAPPDAEEIAQEVFLALFRHLRAGKPRDNLRGWIFRVGHNLALKQRSRGLRLSIRGEFAETPLDPAPDPEEQAADNQHRHRLLAAIDALPERDRNCLSLRAEGLRYREIAEVLGISLGAVAQSIERSLARLSRIRKGGIA
ncbi:MAG: RNA polymerase sigma factor [Bryobacteraceae bacterium]